MPAAPRVRRLRAAGSAPAASCAVESLQLAPVPAALFERSTVARLALGSTFDARDLFWYGVGATAGLVCLRGTTALRCRRRA